MLGDGNDTFIWNPGDGSDTVEGQAGTDTLVFNGSNVNENIDISANGSRARLFRDVGNVTMDLNGVEHIQLAALGGADTITVNDLTGTDVTQVAIDLAGTSAAAGDGQPDSVIVNGTAGDDNISDRQQRHVGRRQRARGAGFDRARRRRQRLARRQRSCRQRHDRRIGLKAGLVNLTINGGDGNDSINGSAGDDMVIGGRGNDMALLGAGNDTFVWNPGDGSDTVEGQTGTDTLAVQRRERRARTSTSRPTVAASG